MYKLIIILFLFLLGFYFIYRSNDIETFTNDNDNDNDNEHTISENCPDMLVQKSNNFFLYNTKRATIPGVNPIRFKNLEEYTEFTEWQRSQGIICPILFLQHSYNTQGEPVYKAHSSPTKINGGLPDYYLNSSNFTENESENDIPDFTHLDEKIMQQPTESPINKLIDAGRDNNNNYNVNSYPGYDSNNQNIGINTPLDKIYSNGENGQYSANAMDTNWGGVSYSRDIVDN